MSRELPDLLPVLEPPPNGLERLRARMTLEREGEGARGPLFERLGLVLVPAATIAAVAVMTFFAPIRARVLFEPPPVELQLSSDPALIRFGLAAPPSATVEIAPRRRADTAAAPASATSEVAVYWLASTAPLE